MNQLPPIDDWAEHMLWAEHNFNKIEKGLIDKQFDNLDNHIKAVIVSMGLLQEWLRRQKAKSE